MARLDVEGLEFVYPGANAATLQDIEFGVASGESLALLGSSGAGKTTLLNLLSGLLLSTRGRILLDGLDVTKLGAGKRGVAQVFQFPVLYDSLNVRDNIGFPLRTRGVARRERRRKAEAMAELFDISAALDEKPAQLSLFQKQLVGFAKALVRDDLALVLLDEPLTAVEPSMKWRLRGIVKRAQAELGTTMVYVTHDQTEALTFADEVSVLHGGRLLQTGSPGELYERPAHSEVARFIGNPGMNVLEADALDGRLRIAGQVVESEFSNLSNGSLEIGFRPEWAEIAGAASRENEMNTNESVEKLKSQSQPLHLSGTLLSQRLTGASAGDLLGVARVAIGNSTAQIACVLGLQPGSPVRLQVNKYQLFRDGVRVSEPGPA